MERANEHANLAKTGGVLRLVSDQTPPGAGADQGCKTKTGATAMGQKALEGVAGVFNRYHRILMRFLCDRLFSRDDAEDMAQEVYYRLARRSDIDELEHPKAFVLQTAANLLIDLNRARQRRHSDDHIDLETLDAELEGDQRSPEANAQYAEDLTAIDKALKELSPVCQTVFIMHRLQGDTYQQIADSQGISVSSVEKHISRALQHIRKRLS